MLAIEGLSTVLRESPDFNSSDSQHEINQLIVRQTAIQDCLTGEQHADVLLDILDSQGINPIEYVACVEQNINFLLSNQLPIEDAQEVVQMVYGEWDNLLLI